LARRSMTNTQAPESPSATFRVHVKPRAKVSKVLSVQGSELTVCVAAPPVDGAANEELVRTLAEHFGVPKRSVLIEKGQGSRTKLVRVVGPSTSR